MTKIDLLHYVSEAVAVSSALLMLYRQFGEQFLLIWIPKDSTSPWALTFYSFIDKLVKTLELVALNQKSLSSKKAEDFVAAAKIALPAEAIGKVEEKVEVVQK